MSNPNQPVGTMGSYGKAPFNNPGRSVPPSVPGATGRQEGAGPHGTAGKGLKEAASFATKQTSPRGC